MSNAVNVLNAAQLASFKDVPAAVCLHYDEQKCNLWGFFLQFSSSSVVFYVFLPTIKGQSAATQQILKCSSL